MCHADELIKKFILKKWLEENPHNPESQAIDGCPTPIVEEAERQRRGDG